MRQASEIFNEAFSAARTPRSSAYREGVLGMLIQQLDGHHVMCPYCAGSAEFDAFWAGTEEGRQHVAREFIRITEVVVTRPPAEKPAWQKVADALEPVLAKHRASPEGVVDGFVSAWMRHEKPSVVMQELGWFVRCGEKP